MGRCAWCNDLDEAFWVRFRCKNRKCKGKKYHEKCLKRHTFHLHEAKPQGSETKT
jgi:hypothetical protein